MNTKTTGLLAIIINEYEENFSKTVEEYEKDISKLESKKNEANQKISVLNLEIVNLRKEVMLIKSSKTWRTRNKLAKLMGRKKV